MQNAAAPVYLAERERPFWGFAEILLIAALFIPAVFAGGFAVQALSPYLHIDPKLGLPLLVAEFLGYGIVFIALALLFGRYRQPLLASLGWVAQPFKPLHLAVLGMVLALVVVILGNILGFPNVETPFDKLLNDPLSRIAIAIFGVSLGPIIEELLFRGYGFQALLAGIGPYATIIPLGVLFAAAHAMNPNASWVGLINTGAFGILFGCAYLRSRDLWLPIGLHLGWNFTLPLFGVHLSGLNIKVTGYEMSWTAGPLWSGGEYGPEASVLTSAVVLVLFVYLWKAPIRRQSSPISEPPAEKAVCEPSSLSPS